ncbi:hypothetical protein ACLMJK_007525 [Lecanora helva]
MLHENGGKSTYSVSLGILTNRLTTTDQLPIVNHKPRASGNTFKSIITPSSDGPSQSFNLSMTEENNGNNYLYKGSQQTSEGAILIYDGRNGSFTLDKIDTEFRFNLCRTPTNDDAASLARQYPQLDTGLQTHEDGEDDLFDDIPEDHDPDSEPPDPSNPYNYRHFLRSNQAGRSPSPEPSHLESPMPNHNLSASPGPAKSSSVRSSYASKPPRRRSHPKPRHLTPNPREEADADNEESEADDVLTIDMGDVASTHNKPWRSVLGNLNEGGRASGPISLRSAASSMSPSLRGDSDIEDSKRSNADVEEIEFDDGGVNAEDNSADFEAVATPGAGLDDEEEEEDPFAAQLEDQLIAEAMSEAEHEEQGAVGVNGGGRSETAVGGVAEQRPVEESSEESEEE